jgi:NAD(P)-dependent dehydrogenase (short-subunit alcohol dehydrogenase family)
MTDASHAGFAFPDMVADHQRFVGKTAIVTGGGASTPTVDADCIGTGAAACLLLGRQGCQVAVLDRDRDAARRTLDVIESFGGKGIAVEADILKEADCERAAAAVADAFGSINFLVNNVGVVSYTSAPVADVAADEWDRVMAINVKSMIFMSRYALRHMPEGGSIINVSSISAFRPHAGGGPYSPSKAAVNGLTIQMAVDYGPRDIRVNAVQPGPVWTPLGASNMTHMAKSGPAKARTQTAEEIREAQLQKTLLPTQGSGWDIATAVGFLCSDESRWITGQSLVVDAGATIRRGR